MSSSYPLVGYCVDMHGVRLVLVLVALMSTLHCSECSDEDSKYISNLLEIVCATDDPILSDHAYGLLHSSRDLATGNQVKSSSLMRMGKDIYDNPQTWKLKELIEPLSWAVEAVSTVASLLDTGSESSGAASDSAQRATNSVLDNNSRDRVELVRAVLSVLARQLAFNTHKSRAPAWGDLTVPLSSASERACEIDQSEYTVPLASASILLPESVHSSRSNAVSDDLDDSAYQWCMESLPNARECDGSIDVAASREIAMCRSVEERSNHLLYCNPVPLSCQQDLADAVQPFAAIRLDRDDDSERSLVTPNVTLASNDGNDSNYSDEHGRSDTSFCNFKSVKMLTETKKTPSLYANLHSIYFPRKQRDAAIHPVLPKSPKLYAQLCDCRYIDLLENDYALELRTCFDVTRNGVQMHGDTWRSRSFGDMIQESHVQFYQTLVSFGLEPFFVSNIISDLRRMQTKSVFLSLFSIGCMLLAELVWPKSLVLSNYVSAAVISNDLFEPNVYAEWLVWPDGGRIVSFRTLWTQLAAAAILLTPGNIRPFLNLRNIAANTDFPVLHPQAAISKEAERAPAAMLCKLRAIFMHLLSNEKRLKMSDFAKNAIFESVHTLIKYVVARSITLTNAPFGCGSSLNAATLTAAARALENTRWTVAHSAEWMRTVIMYTIEYNQHKDTYVSMIYDAIVGPKRVSLFKPLAAKSSVCRSLLRASAYFSFSYEIDPFLAYVAMRQAYNHTCSHTGPFESSMALFIAFRSLAERSDAHTLDSDGPALFPNNVALEASSMFSLLVSDKLIDFETISLIYQMLHTPISANKSDEENTRIINCAGIRDPVTVRSIISATRALKIGNDDAVCAAHLLYVASSAFYIAESWDSDNERVSFIIQRMLSGKPIVDDVIDYIAQTCIISDSVSLAIAHLTLLAAVHAQPCVRLRGRRSNGRLPLPFDVHVRIYSLITTEHCGVDARIAIDQVRKLGYPETVLRYLETVWLRPYNSVHVITQIEFVTGMCRALGYTDAVNVAVAYPASNETLICHEPDH